MAWTTLQKFHTITAAEINNNFYHVGQGDLLPRGNAALEATTGVYDLGSSNYEWANVYATNLNFDGEMQLTFNKIAEISVAAAGSATARLEFTGLNGDTDEIYEIRARFVYTNTATAYNIFANPNGDSTTNNYGYQYIDGYSITVSAVRALSIGGFMVGVANSLTAGTHLCHSEVLMYAKTGYVRTALATMSYDINGTTVKRLIYTGAVWNDTTSTITTLVINSVIKFIAGTTVELWALR